ncbi:MAG: UDP-N-acetylmuramoyl-L-alanyl-D-glutamate--2,6-diaminopimelate ligase [bacterium]|nr:UDP-N-acetylmuramoyl-L-alanyl-D-glutamate--2,6-diaminopimelate ligase [bacterium]
MHKIKNFIRLIISFIYSVYYGFPQRKLKIIGVTGTDGKTTTSNFIYHLLTKNGFKVGLISTINARIGDKEIDTGFHVTSPDPQVVIKLLNQMVKEGVEYAILEVTSHGLSQNRFGNIDFDYAVVTNITPEHLDYHKTYDNYLYTKAKLILKSKLTFINKDDSLSYEKLRQFASNNYKKVRAYALSSLDSNLSNQLRQVLSKNFPGIYNQQNALAALTVFTRIVGKEISEETISQFMDIKSLEGRFNRVQNNLGLNIIIDFAHTPNALEKILEEVRNLREAGEKIISVFGCAGLRDSSKRPVMGKISGELADVVVVTAEDPRTEDLDKINKQIVEGIEKVNGEYIVENDRQKAIEKAVTMANKGDWILITGKGHEKSMCFGTTETPWSDFDAVEEALTSQT